MIKTIIIISWVLCFGLASGVFADEHVNAQGNIPQSSKGMKIESPAKCKNCGMYRTVFTSSRVLITFTDGTSVGTCSINCAYEEITKNASKKIKNIKVADYVSKKLIDAKKAAWVIGGRKQGVMSTTAKWAFSDKAEADRFILENGGKIANFEEAWKAAAQ
jgi:nitrous oxide reductase accessory protein NosL